MSIGLNIKLLRREKNITQVELAKMLKTSQQVITSYEREVNKPDPDKIPMIAEALGFPIEVLFDPSLRFLKTNASESKPRKGSRLSKIQTLYEALTPSAQRLILKQVKSLVQNP